GDGKLDLAVAQSTGGFGVGPAAGGGPIGAISIFLGKGDGSLAGPITMNRTTTPTVLAVGDFNGDGKLDLATVDAGQPDAPGSSPPLFVSILPGLGDGTFGPDVRTPTVGVFGQGPAF